MGNFTPNRPNTSIAVTNRIQKTTSFVCGKSPDITPCVSGYVGNRVVNPMQRCNQHSLGTIQQESSPLLPNPELLHCCGKACGHADFLQQAQDLRGVRPQIPARLHREAASTCPACV